jgi:hypothetical protein
VHGGVLSGMVVATRARGCALEWVEGMEARTKGEARRGMGGGGHQVEVARPKGGGGGESCLLLHVCNAPSEIFYKFFTSLFRPLRMTVAGKLGARRKGGRLRGGVGVSCGDYNSVIRANNFFQNCFSPFNH